MPAGGTGSRMSSRTGEQLPKQFLLLNGIPVLVRSCLAFLQTEAVHALAIAAPADYYQQTQTILRQYLSHDQWAKIRIVHGGATRQESVAAGLRALPDSVELVLVHDAARPLVDQETIRRCMFAAMQHGAAIAAVPVHDTLKLSDSENRVLRTVERKGLWRAQTPQAAQRDLLDTAFAEALQKNISFTDEAALLEAMGIPVHLVEGSARNLKITLPEDLRIASALLEEESGMNIGHGFDAHRLVAGRRLVLGGVDIEHSKGLDGHSDADVVAHALCDALLGALAEGDLGRHFPDTDPQYRGINSLLLLEHVYQKVRERGLRLHNADISILCQAPKLAPHIPAMRVNLARACTTEPERINIKATTTEKMGYIGREEGIASHAVVLLRYSASPVKNI